MSTPIWNRVTQVARAAFLAVSVATAGRAQSTAPAPLHVPLVPGAAPRIDGGLSDSAWTRAAEIPLRFQWFPDDGSVPSVETRCRIMATKETLFLACVAHDPTPDQIVAIRRDRDVGDVDDEITITVDPFGDGREAFMFGISASGVLSDAQLGRTTGFDGQWNALWDGRSQRTADGYSVELAIPFAALRMPAAAHTLPTRVVIERRYPRRHVYRFAATALDRNERCVTCQGLPVVLPATTRGGYGLLLQPTLVAATQREAGGRLSELELGGAMRWQATPSTRLSTTWNPDFSQVEADELDFEINRRFVLTFDERRPFFLEGREMLEGFGNLVFSRRVVDPRWGVRALNRGASHSAALLMTRETSDTRIVPGAYSSSRMIGTGGASTAVGRFRLLHGRNVSIGTTATARVAERSRNAVGALDADIQFGGRHRLRLVTAASASRYDIDSTRSEPQGGMAHARYDVESREWGTELSVRAISTDFRADAGLVQRVNVWGPEMQLRRRFFGRDAGWFSEITASIDAQYLQTFEARLIDGKTGAALRWAGPFQSSAEVQVTNRHSAIDSVTYRHLQVEWAAAVRGDARWDAEVGATVGEEPDVDNARLGHIRAARLAVALTPLDAVTITGVARHEQLSANARWVYRAAIGDLRLEIYPRPESRIRLTAQYSASRRNPSGGIVDGDPRRARMTFQALGSQRLGTRALAFVGYVGSGSLVDGAPRWPGGRSVFAKVAWDLAR